MRYYVIHPNGQKYGPADIQTLHQWLAEGRLTPVTELESEDSGQRMSASMVLGAPGPNFGAQNPQATYSQPGPAQNPWSQAPGGSPYPRDSYSVRPGGDTQTLVTLSWIFGAIGILCCPIIFSTAGIVMSAIALSRGNQSARASLAFSIISLIVGTIFGIVANSMDWVKMFR